MSASFVVVDGARPGAEIGGRCFEVKSGVGFFVVDDVNLMYNCTWSCRRTTGV